MICSWSLHRDTNGGGGAVSKSLLLLILLTWRKQLRATPGRAWQACKCQRYLHSEQRTPRGFPKKSVAYRLVCLNCSWEWRKFVSVPNKSVEQCISWKLVIAQFFKKSPALHVTRRIITVFTRACHWTLLWASWIHPLNSFSFKHGFGSYDPFPVENRSFDQFHERSKSRVPVGL
jgi:hypothetical protein